MLAGVVAEDVGATEVSLPGIENGPEIEKDRFVRRLVVDQGCSA